MKASPRDQLVFQSPILIIVVVLGSGWGISLLMKEVDSTPNIEAPESIKALVSFPLTPHFISNQEIRGCGFKNLSTSALLFRFRFFGAWSVSISCDKEPVGGNVGGLS